MKNFILGIIVTLIIGAWITLAVVGVISVKTAILVPVGIVIGLLIAMASRIVVELIGDKRKMKKLTNAEKAEIHKQLEEAEKAKFKPYEDKIADLEKENAELKLKLEALEGQTPWKDIKDKSEVIGNLTKAKEFLKKVLDLKKVVTKAEQYLLLDEVEQFLNEVEE